MAESADHPTDLAARPGTVLLAWGIPSAVILLTVVFDVGVVWQTGAWVAALAWAGAACLFNASRCGRVHCYITGPFFLLLAGASLGHGLGILPLGPGGWQWIGLSFLVGGCLLTFVPEWIWGTYRERGPDQCC
jgi:hypothetical protein